MRFVLVAAIGLAGAGIMWTYKAAPGLGKAGENNPQEELRLYKERLAKLAAQHDALYSTANAAESQLNIERAAQKQLAEQVKSLLAENTRLKEDLAFFESLLPNATGPAGLAIRRLKVDLVPPNQVRYRLLVMQGGNGDRRFTGMLQLAVTTMQDGKSAMMIFPDGSPAEQQRFKLNFMHYQRVEGVLTLPDGVQTKAVQARVLENGQVRAQLSANL